MNIFYCPAAVLNEYCVLDETESHHVAKVLRKKEGEELFVFDGKGNLFDTRITAIGKKDVGVHVVRLMEQDINDKPRLHMAVAPPKNIERMEWFIEKATEIGVDEITPLICAHSERKGIRIDRLLKVAVSACKQSLHYTIPRINEPLAFNQLVASVNNSTRRYIAYCHEKSTHFKDAYHGGFDAVILIGPEGDFTREEVVLATKNEFETVSLGKKRLRLETAALFSVAAFNLVNT